MTVRYRLAAGAGVVADDQGDHGERHDPEHQGVVLEQPEQGARVLRRRRSGRDRRRRRPDWPGARSRSRAALASWSRATTREGDAGEQRPSAGAAVARGGRAATGVGCGHGVALGGSSSVTPVPGRCAGGRSDPARRSSVDPPARSAAPAGARPRWTTSASVSSATDGEVRGDVSASPSTQSSIRSSRARPASLRRSWIARWSSRASPSARRSSVSSVSMTTTRPSSWATAVPGRGVARISTSSGGEGDAGERHGAVRRGTRPRSRGRRP